MIEIKNITKIFGDRTVLNGIDGVFQQGQTSLIIGGSGTGKSVLLKCMLGLFKPETGSVLYDGRDFLKGDEDIQRAIRQEMGVLFQGGALFDSKTVLENVKFPLDMLDKTMSEAQKIENVFMISLRIRGCSANNYKSANRRRFVQEFGKRGVFFSS